MIITIKWDTGSMKIDTSSWFRENKSMKAFRKLLKMAQKSDREYGTDAVAGLKNVIVEHQNALMQEKETAYEFFEAECVSIEREYEAKLKAALEKRKKRFIREQKSNTKGLTDAENMLKLCEEVHDA